MSAARSFDPRILIADNSEIFLQDLGSLLGRSGFNEVVPVLDSAHALKELASHNYNLAIIDLGPESSGSLEVLRATRRRGIATGIVVLAESGTSQMVVEAMQEGARHYFDKPIEEESFIAVISSLVESTRRCAHVLGVRLDDYLREQVGTVGLKLEDVCHEFSISVSYLERIFHDYHQTSVKRRLNFHRVEKARQLLETTNYAIWEIAEKCGFRNYRRLEEAFKKAGEMPPGVYRLMFRSRKAVGKKAAGKNAPPEK